MGPVIGLGVLDTTLISITAGWIVQAAAWSLNQLSYAGCALYAYCIIPS